MIGVAEARLRQVLAWIVIVLLVVPVGGALWLGVAHGESPCILCWAQRTSMVLIALVALFVVRYGPRPRYLGMVVLLGAWGTFMSLRHSALHLARDVGQGFAGSILGAHTYVWSWVIHWLVLLVVGTLLILLRGGMNGDTAQPPGRTARFAMVLLVFMAAANAVQAFISTGPPPYIGQADPIRLSLNPRYWVWMNDELDGPVSWRGAWSIPRPEATSVETDPAAGPLPGLATLPVLRWEQISADIEGAITGMAIGPDGSAVVTTDAFGVFLLDSTLATVRHRVILDRGFSIDLSPLAGAAFIGDTIAVLSSNKSYVLLRTDPAADPVREWRHFLESDGGIAELRRSRLATVRARQLYVQSLAYDRAADELITVGVPSPRHQRLVVSRFDRADFMLSSEFLVRAAAALPPLPEGRSLAEYRVTGATVRDGVLYAISDAYSTLLAIDLRTRELVAAYPVTGLSAPVGLAQRGSELLIVQRDGRIAVIAPR